MIPTDLDRLDLRREWTRVRDAVNEIVAAGQDPAPLIQGLASRSALALFEVVAGPRAASGPTVTRAALENIEALEGVVGTASLYRRLGVNAGEAGLDVLREATTRHPTAEWVVSLSTTLEGNTAGWTQLMFIESRPEFVDLCWAHAQAGHRQGLVNVAGELGRPEPAAALLSCGAADSAIAAATATLRTNPSIPIAPWLYASYGPNISDIINRIGENLSGKAREQIERYQQQLRHEF